MEPCD
jgi:hypothetical protein